MSEENLCKTALPMSESNRYPGGGGVVYSLKFGADCETLRLKPPHPPYWAHPLRWSQAHLCALRSGRVDFLPMILRGWRHYAQHLRQGWCHRPQIKPTLVGCYRASRRGALDSSFSLKPRYTRANILLYTVPRAGGETLT